MPTPATPTATVLLITELNALNVFPNKFDALESSPNILLSPESPFRFDSKSFNPFSIPLLSNSVSIIILPSAICFIYLFI